MVFQQCLDLTKTGKELLSFLLSTIITIKVIAFLALMQMICKSIVDGLAKYLGKPILTFHLFSWLTSLCNDVLPHNYHLIAKCTTLLFYILN